MKGKTKREKLRHQVDFYAFVAPFYDFLAGSFLRPARKAIVRAVKSLGCRRILDVACGTGEQAIMLAKEGLEVTGIDLSSAMLRVARRKSPPAVAYLLGDALHLPFRSESFDCVTVSLALHEMTHDTRMGTVREILRVLCPDGMLIVFDYAAPQNWSSACGLALLGLMERIAGGEHFRSFVRFARTGGIDQFLRAFPLEITGYRSYFPGALRLVLSQKR
jgi:demethylmenaquinone methyltransferase/2-methoxy-6-polyprenyl-1,4-benzoquinol methylase